MISPFCSSATCSQGSKCAWRISSPFRPHMLKSRCWEFWLCMLRVATTSKVVGEHESPPSFDVHHFRSPILIHTQLLIFWAVIICSSVVRCPFGAPVLAFQLGRKLRSNFVIPNTTPSLGASEILDRLPKQEKLFDMLSHPSSLFDHTLQNLAFQVGNPKKQSGKRVSYGPVYC